MGMGTYCTLTVHTSLPCSAQLNTWFNLTLTKSTQTRLSSTNRIIYSQSSASSFPFLFELGMRCDEVYVGRGSAESWGAGSCVAFWVGLGCRRLVGWLRGSCGGVGEVRLFWTFGDERYFEGCIWLLKLANKKREIVQINVKPISPKLSFEKIRYLLSYHSTPPKPQPIQDPTNSRLFPLRILSPHWIWLSGESLQLQKSNQFLLIFKVGYCKHCWVKDFVKALLTKQRPSRCIIQQLILRMQLMLGRVILILVIRNVLGVILSIVVRNILWHLELLVFILLQTNLGILEIIQGGNPQLAKSRMALREWCCSTSPIPALPWTLPCRFPNRCKRIWRRLLLSCPAFHS